MTRIADLVPGVFADRLPASVATHRANWIEVARTDLADARRSWLLWALGVVFALVVLLIPWHLVVLFPDEFSEIPFKIGVGNLGSWISLLIPLVALLVGAVAVAGEREAGSLRVLLGLPITRRDVVVGKLLARSVVVTGVLLFGLVPAAVELGYLFGSFDLGRYAIFVATQIGYGLLFVWIGVGISAFVRSHARALGAGVGAYALFIYAWEAIPNGAFYLVEGQFPENVPPPWDPPAWLIFLRNANPVAGFRRLAAEWSPNDPAGRGFGYPLSHVEGTDPFYVQPEFLLVVVLLWGLVPLLVGTRRFARSDVG